MLTPFDLDAQRNGLKASVTASYDAMEQNVAATLQGLADTAKRIAANPSGVTPADLQSLQAEGDNLLAALASGQVAMLKALDTAPPKSVPDVTDKAKT